MKFFWRSAVVLQILSLTVAPAFADTMSGASTTSTAPGANSPKAPAGSAKTAGSQEEVNVKGQYKDKLEVGKFDPPAAFNLEDIQNFPEDRLFPVLNNPLIFEEGRDFTTLMDFQEEQLFHPWLPEFARSPFLTMKTDVEKSPREWTFSVIDQGGATVEKQDGKGTPPATISWNGADSVRDYAAVETVYIPQLATTDKDGYHHTYSGQPIQFSSLIYGVGGHAVVELSSKRLFQDKKSDWTKEAPVFLEKLTDILRESGDQSISIQPYDADNDLGRDRQKALKDYLVDKLHMAPEQIQTPEPQGIDKRGNAMAVMIATMPGGAS